MMGLCCYVAGSILAIEVRVNPLPIAFAAAILYGIAFGWTFVCLNAITARFYGPSAYPKLNGMMLLPTSVACAPAGIVGGAVFDKLGSYTGALPSIGPLPLSAFLPLALQPHRNCEEAEARCRIKPSDIAAQYVCR